MNKEDEIKNIKEDIISEIQNKWSKDFADIDETDEECEEGDDSPYKLEDLAIDTSDIDVDTLKEFYDRAINNYRELFKREWYAYGISIEQSGAIERIQFTMKKVSGDARKRYSFTIHGDGRVEGDNVIGEFLRNFPFDPLFKDVRKCVTEPIKLMLAQSILIKPNVPFRALLQ